MSAFEAQKISPSPLGLAQPASSSAEAPQAKPPTLLTLLEITKNVSLADAEALASEAGVSVISARILLARGFTSAEAIRNFLNPSLRHQLSNPSQIKNILAAADLLLDFVESGELITVYTDFDVDGVSAGAQLYLYLLALGAKVSTYTPSRFAEGYGLVCAAVQKLAESGTKLLVTVDCGISSIKEFALARELGMRSIVLDHHIPGELPPADVVVDPAQDGCPFQEHKLAAAGLVWMLLIVLRQAARERFKDDAKRIAPDPKEFLDLAALGTICDMVPLTGLNRVIAFRGIEALKASTRPGVLALKEIAGVEGNPRFGSGQVGFALGPRINAAGRLGDATQVIEMLTTTDSLRAKSIAASIDRLNDQRRQIEETAKATCLKLLADQPAHLTRRGLAIFNADFHIGVIGIVAQRLVEQFHRPVAIMAPGEMILPNGERRVVVKGSVRSVKGFHVADALQTLTALLLSHGGHAEAGGFSLLAENLEVFSSGFVDAAESMLGVEQLRRRVQADVEARFQDINFDFVNELMRFAPFGIGNPSPVLFTRGVNVETVALLSDKHLRIRLGQDRFYLEAVCWNFAGNPLLRKGQRVDIAFQPEINTYQGVSKVQLSLREVWPHETSSAPAEDLGNAF